LQKEPRQKSTHIKIATKTETKIDRHKICNKNLDKSTHIKKSIYSKIATKIERKSKTHKNCKNCNKITHTHTKEAG
jgi:hypothetical protein